MIVVLDPGIGNLSSVQSGFARVGAETTVVKSGEEWEDLLSRMAAASSGKSDTRVRGSADERGVVGERGSSGQRGNGGERGISGVVLPGVGAFGDAMFQLRRSGLLSVVKRVAKEGMPLFGICLGMQILFSQSEEHGSHIGLGLLPGSVVRFTGDYKIPHMGWNNLVGVRRHPLLNGICDGDFVYFVHSYYARVEDETHLLAAADYAGVKVSAVVGHDNVVGTQFHPEKSGPVGEKILMNFVAMCRAYETQAGVSSNG